MEQWDSWDIKSIANIINRLISPRKQYSEGISDIHDYLRQFKDFFSYLDIVIINVDAIMSGTYGIPDVYIQYNKRNVEMTESVEKFLMKNFTEENIRMHRINEMIK